LFFVVQTLLERLISFSPWDKTNINVDFTIVACATFYKLDIVVSDDSKTMLSKPALKAFKHICVKEGFWHPNFWKYSDLRTRYGF